MHELRRESREEIQAAAIQAWVAHDKVGTIVLPTGMGKTYVGIVVACGLLKKKLINNVLICVPTRNLITQWEKEILKWGYTLDGITIKCIQSVYKKESEYDLLLVDEVHTSKAEKYSQVFIKVKHRFCLGLSATIEENEVIKKYCPIVFESTVQQALEADAFNEYVIHNIAVPFNRKEAAHYKTFDNQFKIGRLQLLLLKNKFPEYKDLSIFDIAKLHSTSKEKTDIVKYSKMFWNGMTLRKRLCYLATSKALAAAKIVENSTKDQWIIFTMSIDLAEHLATLISNSKVYHSKQKPELRDEILQAYKDKEFDVLITVKALDAGLNIPDTSRAIAISGDSQELVAIQRLGHSAHTYLIR